MKDDKKVFCDTGFVIRLLDETNDLHNNALGYSQYFLEHDYLCLLPLGISFKLLNC